ncbi:PP2C family protein-serine/threonine phosphatase [Botrimarina mediterranea]|nr:PP2C family protein-serine/threonine phosphatase [Botrimarina mediterranea]
MAVNLPLAMLAAVFLAYDYSHELARRIDIKRVALEEEAKTLFPAVIRLSGRGPESVQDFIDEVCVRMQDAESPGHHIAVEKEGDTFQASAHHRDSREMLLAMQEAAESPLYRAPLGNAELVVGAYASEGTTVYVSESLENLRRSATGDTMRRLVGFLFMATVAAAVVNMVLFRVVSRPLQVLVGTVKKIGEGDFRLQSDSFRTNELGYLADEINSMSQSLAASEKTRLLQMAQAREIQRNLLPNGVEADGFEVAQLFEPAEDVGGDFFDILMLCDRSWLVCVADVSGHGIPAAMNAAMLKTLVMQAAKTLVSPSQILQEANQQFTSMSLEGDFATVFMLRIDPCAGRFSYASAGHDPGWLLTEGTNLKQLPSTGLILGIDEDVTWEEPTGEFAAGDRMLIATDGVCETSDSSGRLFGRDRIGELLAHYRDAPADGVINLLNQALNEHRGAARQTDDVTALLIERNPGSNC